MQQLRELDALVWKEEARAVTGTGCVCSEIGAEPTTGNQDYLFSAFGCKPSVYRNPRFTVYRAHRSEFSMHLTTAVYTVTGTSTIAV